MKKLFLLLLLAFTLWGCEFDYPQKDYLVIGNIPDNTFIQTIHNPPSVYHADYEPLKIDMDGDSLADVQIRYDWSYWPGDKEYLSEIKVLNNNFEVATREFSDTIYRCVTQTVDGIHTHRYTGYDSHTCPEDGDFSVEEVITHEYPICLSLHDTLQEQLSWQNGSIMIFSGQVLTMYNDIRNTERAELHFGSSFFDMGHYLGIRKIVAEGYKYGYIKIRMIYESNDEVELFETFLDI